MFENRIVGHGMIKPEELLANPRNFKIHTKLQHSMMQGILEEIGFISSVIVNKKTGFMVDGHMRVILAMRNNMFEIPVEYVELTEEEEMKALALYDYVTSKAEIDKQKVQELLAELGSSSEVIQMMSAEMFPQKKQLERIVNIPRLEKEAVNEIQDSIGKVNSDIEIKKGVKIKLGDSILICADPTVDWALFLDCLLDAEPETRFYPWGSIFSALSPENKVIVQPDVDICVMILSFYIKAKGAKNVSVIE